MYGGLPVAAGVAAPGVRTRLRVGVPVATYEYRCPRDGDFEMRFPLGTAAARVTCSYCGADAARVFSAPLLARTPRPLAAAIDRAERSAEAPEVVTSLPPRPRRARRPEVNPALARLPRP